MKALFLLGFIFAAQFSAADTIRLTSIRSVGTRIYGNHTQGLMIYGNYYQDGIKDFELDFNVASPVELKLYDKCWELINKYRGSAVPLEFETNADGLITGCLLKVGN